MAEKTRMDFANPVIHTAKDPRIKIANRLDAISDTRETLILQEDAQLPLSENCHLVKGC